MARSFRETDPENGILERHHHEAVKIKTGSLFRCCEGITKTSHTNKTRTTDDCHEVTPIHLYSPVDLFFCWMGEDSAGTQPSKGPVLPPTIEAEKQEQIPFGQDFLFLKFFERKRAGFYGFCIRRREKHDQACEYTRRMLG
jgi:hypothetical protein